MWKMRLIPNYQKTVTYKSWYLDKFSTYKTLGKGKYIISKLKRILDRSKISSAKTKADN